jgi:hypothetical protein
MLRDKAQMMMGLSRSFQYKKNPVSFSPILEEL